MGVEHELRQRPVQARDAALHQRKARAGQFGRHLEIQAQPRRQVDMVLNLEIEAARGADLAHFDIAGFIAARPAPTRAAGSAPPRMKSLSCACTWSSAPPMPSVRRRCRPLPPAPRRHPRPYLSTCRSAWTSVLRSSLQVFGTGLDCLRSASSALKAAHVKLEAARGQTGGDGVDILAEQLNVDHGGMEFRVQKPSL